MPVDSQRVQALFLKIVELPGDQRAAALQRECGGDAELQRRVEALLIAHDQPDSFLDQSPNQFAATQDSSPLAAEGATADYHRQIEPGAVIAGRYTLQQRIGEGGMGEVWVARQTEPVKRKVAVKLIKTGMDSRAVLGRFEQERQALAMMDHPNIAHVLDGGMTSAGQPFFVMELVNGLPLTAFCDQAKMTLRDRLELFVPICQAVQHAHQKGIVHRDLKPANILVTMIDGKPVPKVIDFGVAKATVGKLTEETLSTQFGAVVGTLEYMSPEQAGYSGSDIDTRSDIYSLGVVLYELLTGLRPIDRTRLKEAGLAEMIRVIREEEPSRPSTRLSTSESLPSVAAIRGIDPGKLTSLMRGELDWVVMKCLEKQRERRYETTNALVRDIQRYLADEPVEARPPSAGYRMGKFFRRNRRSVVAAGLVLVSMVIGIIGTTWGLIEARRHAQIAVLQAEAAEKARGAEAQQRQIAEQANRQAFDALESFTSDLMGNLLGSRELLTDKETSILKNAQQQWEVFANSRGDSAEARRIQAEGAANLGFIQFKLGMNDQAVDNERKAVEITDALCAEFPADDKLKLLLGRRLQNLGGSLRSNGQRAEAAKKFERAMQVFESLSLAHPEQTDYRIRWSKSCISVANSARDFGNWAEAERFYNKALGIQEKLIDEQPGNDDFAADMANSHWGLAFLNKRMANHAEAGGHYQKAISVYQSLVEKVPGSVNFRQSLARLLQEFGVLHSDRSEDADAIEQFSKALLIQESLVDEFPSVPEYRFDLAKTRRDLAQAQGYLDEAAEAEGQFEMALGILRRLTQEQSAALLYRRELGVTLRMLGDMRSDGGDPETAIGVYGEAIQFLTETYVQDPKVTLVKKSLCNSYENRADLFDRLNRHADALKDREKVLDLCDDEMRPIHQFQRADSRLRSGEVAESIVEIAELAKLENPNPNHWYRFAALYAIASEKLPDQKTEFANRAVELLTKAISMGFDDKKRVQEDPDFAQLRDRDDFKKLLAEMIGQPMSKE